jgi:hypothetical protein
VNWLEKLWRNLLRDVVLTGVGVFLILRQGLSAHPSGLTLGAGLALTVPSVAAHLKALLPEYGEGSSSESSPPPGSSPASSTSREASGE